MNLKGTFHGLRAAVPHLQAGGGGSVITMASVSGIRPTRGEAPYAAAKAGVIALTRSAALEYGPDGVRVNAVSPGFIRTPLTEFTWSMPEHLAAIEAGTPLGRTGTADDIAGVVVFLASDLAGLRHGSEPGGRRREPAAERPDGSPAARSARGLIGIYHLAP